MQVTDIRSGKPVALNLKSRIPDEIFVFGAVYINAEPEKYVRFITDTERLSKLPEYPGIGKFSNPPQAADMKNFELDSDDIAALKKCKPGDCMLQLPSRGMELFQKSINWSAPDAARQVNDLLRKTAAQRIIDYQKGGNQILGEYNDKENPRKVAEQFKYMISYSKGIAFVSARFLQLPAQLSCGETSQRRRHVSVGKSEVRSEADAADTAHRNHARERPE